MAPLAVQFEEEGRAPLHEERSVRLLAGHGLPARPRSFINQESSTHWTPSKSCALYNIDGWGAPYFCANADGNMTVRPHGHQTKLREEIDLVDVINQALKPKINGGLGLTMPAIFRFPDVLKDRLHTLQSCFDDAVASKKYRGRFQGVFPVKCNQDHSVINNIMEFGKAFAFGLEAGSKPELLLAMAALCNGSPQALLVCNGYKDADYVCLALLARLIGLNSVIVLEQAEELDLVMSISKKLCIEPVIGLRAKLNTKHAGHFGGTSGEKGKFGLSSSEIMTCMSKLRRMRKMNALQLLHFHIGSQIPSLAILNDGVTEAAQIYCELARMGAGMKFIDVGGGLGVDYDGTNSASSDMSVGYTMEQYAREVVGAIKGACDMKGVHHPTLCSESGRALVSHHSVLVFDILSSSGHIHKRSTAMAEGVSLEVEGLPASVRCLHSSLIGSVRAREYQNALESAKQLKQDCVGLFKHGRLGLAQLAQVNNLHDNICASVEESRQAPAMASAARLPIKLDKEEHNAGIICASVEESRQAPAMASAAVRLPIKLEKEEHNAVYHMNLSVFRSIPDTWAIGQLFPIVPLQRLGEEPTVKAMLSDLTCDSDGKIGKFVGRPAAAGKQSRQRYVKVHEIEEGQPYYMGMFLGGAYQEALGSLHNLFGCPNAVTVQSTKVAMEEKTFKVAIASQGQTSGDVLRLMKHDPSAMLDALKHQVHKTLSSEQEEVARGIIHAIAYSFGSSTYLSTNNFPSSILAQGLLSAISSSSVISSKLSSS